MTMEHNTSLDNILNPVEMLGEFSDVDTVLNEFLLGSHSHPNEHVKMTGYISDTVTSTNQMEPISNFSSKDNSGPNTSEKFNSVINEPICTSIDMASDTNDQKGSLNDGQCDALPCIPANSLQRHVEIPVPELVSSFCKGQYTHANSNGLIYKICNNAVRI